MMARFSVLKNVLSGRFNARDDFWVVQVAKKPSQLVFVPSMAIFQDDRMAVFGPNYGYIPGCAGRVSGCCVVAGSRGGLLVVVYAGFPAKKPGGSHELPVTSHHLVAVPRVMYVRMLLDRHGCCCHCYCVVASAFARSKFSASSRSSISVSGRSAAHP